MVVADIDDTDRPIKMHEQFQRSSRQQDGIIHFQFRTSDVPARVRTCKDIVGISLDEIDRYALEIKLFGREDNIRSLAEIHDRAETFDLASGDVKRMFL